MPFRAPPSPAMQTGCQGNPRGDGLRALRDPVLQVFKMVMCVLIAEFRRIQRTVKRGKFPCSAGKALFSLRYFAACGPDFRTSPQSDRIRSHRPIASMERGFIKSEAALSTEGRAACAETGFEKKKKTGANTKRAANLETDTCAPRGMAHVNTIRPRFKCVAK